MAETRTPANDTAATTKDAEATKVPRRRRITKRKAVEAHVRSYHEALANRDHKAAAAHWREDGVDEVVPLAVLRGRQEIERFLGELFAATPNLEWTVKRVVAGERQAAVEWQMRGTFDGAPFQGIEPTGRPVEMRGIDLFEVEDGEIVGNTGYYDGAAFARQIGMLPAQDSGAERAMVNAFNTVTRLRRVVNERRNP